MQGLWGEPQSLGQEAALEGAKQDLGIQRSVHLSDTPSTIKIITIITITTIAITMTGRTGSSASQSRRSTCPAMQLGGVWMV